MNIFWVILGLVSLFLGFLGLFLPLLPTTPLWLLSAFSLMKGSKRLYEWAMSFKTFNEIVTNFQIHRAIPLRIKVLAISMLWISIVLSCIVVERWWLVVLLLCIAVAVTLHILSYRTLRDDE